MNTEENNALKKLDWLLAIIGSFLVLLVGWGAYQIYEMKGDMALILNHVEEADEFHDKIPDGFFIQDRYGWNEEFPNRQATKESIALLDKRIELVKEEFKSHEALSKIYIAMIQDLISSHNNTADHGHNK